MSFLPRVQGDGMDADTERAGVTVSSNSGNSNRYRNLQVSSRAASITKPRTPKFIPKEPVKGAIGPNSSPASPRLEQRTLDTGKPQANYSAVAKHEQRTAANTKLYTPQSVQNGQMLKDKTSSHRQDAVPYSYQEHTTIAMSNTPSPAVRDTAYSNHSKNSQPFTSVAMPNTPSPAATNTTYSSLNQNSLQFSSSSAPASLSKPTVTSEQQGL